MYYSIVLIVSLVLSVLYTCATESVCDQPSLFQFNTSLLVCDNACGGEFPNVESGGMISCKLNYPSKSLLTILLEQGDWITGVRIHNINSDNVTTFSLAYTDRVGVEFIPISIATLYNSSLPSGDLVEVRRGEYLLIKFQKPIQPYSLSVFGYGAVGAEGCISVELLGCSPSSLSYPIHTPNLLQYRFPKPDNLHTDSTGVEYGYLYGSDGVLTDGIEYTTSSDCLNTECLTWYASSSPSDLYLSFSLYQSSSILMIEIIQINSTDNPIDSLAINSPGVVPSFCTNYSATQYQYSLTFDNPINTDYVQIIINFHDTLTLTEIIFYDSYGNNVLKSVVSIIGDVTSPDYLTALIASSSTFIVLLILLFSAMIVLIILACRSHRNLSRISNFYDTLTPESFAIYTSIKRSSKHREYVNVARMDLSTKLDSVTKSSQPLPRKPEIVLKCMSETSSIDHGDYEKVEQVLAEHESSKNCTSNDSTKYNTSSVTKDLANNLTFINHREITVKPDNRKMSDVIIYDSSHISPVDTRKYSNLELTSKNSPGDDDPYTPYNPNFNENKIISKEHSHDHIPITMSVSNNHLYKLAASRHSPTEHEANFQFVEDSSDITTSFSVKQLAGMTLSQLDDSISSDSV
ncbi:hypothetical protein LOD99_3354 [Oopsacas minuta]|uniref:CUB domain-containing protein n=1 Tax=Oopsacas minuta TaxID=111878 RepID=A0AAV7JY68_9METZ|nr:hypothetical protein LOD99_3354 [Oopsacas minuta]